MDYIVEHNAGNLTFDQQDIDAMTIALDAVCMLLNVRKNTSAREFLASCVIEIARSGERSAIGLEQRLVADARGSGRFLMRRELHAA